MATRATGYTREDKQCICGMYRHSTCPSCGGGELKSVGGELLDHLTREPHVCGATAMTDTPQAVVLPDSIVAGSDDEARWKDLIPSEERFRAYIPRKVDGSTDLDHLRIALKAHQNVLLFGPKGAGKNHLTEALAAIEGLPIIAASFSLGIREEDLIGQMTLRNGSTVFEDGALTWLMRHGGIFVADEVNAAPREVAFALHQVTDSRRQLVLTVNGREIVRAHPRFMFIGTMNPDYAGTRELNEAFEDRFHVSLEIDYNDDVEDKLIKDKRLLKLARAIRTNHKGVTDDRLTKTVSTRAMMAHEDNVRLHGEEVAKSVFVNRWRGEDKAAVEKVYDAHMKGSR